MNLKERGGMRLGSNPTSTDPARASLPREKRGGEPAREDGESGSKKAAEEQRERQQEQEEDEESAEASRPELSPGSGKGPLWPVPPRPRR